MSDLRFEWDKVKAKAGLKKHGVSFTEAKTVWDDDLAIEAPDKRHSKDEARFVVIGLSERFRLLTVIYTERDEAIRIISARQSNRTETAGYAEENSGS